MKFLKSRKPTYKVNETKIWLFKNMKKIEKPLDKWVVSKLKPYVDHMWTTASFYK